MIQPFRGAPKTDLFCTLTAYQWKVLRLLSAAWLAACAERRDVWQFAVDIERLLALGLSPTDLRCLVCWDYLQHAQERTTARSSQRIFRPLKTLTLPKRTCFVLTAKGREVVSESLGETAERVDASTEGSRSALGCVREAPRWDSEARQLWWGTYLVKEFRRPALNQELVLAALEEERWPKQLDDPLPPKKYIDAKVRLHDTIKCLNRRYLHRIIRFGGDGSGRRIQWFFVKES